MFDEGNLVGLRWVRVGWWLGSWVAVVEIWVMKSLEKREKESLG